MPMYGHHMAPTNHQTTPHPSDALYIHAATCLDTLPSIWVLMVNCGGAWWCQELIGCPCRNTSKTKFCSCPCTDTTWPPRNHQTTPYPSDALCMHDATCLDTLPSVLVFMLACGGTLWCQELMGCPGKNTSKIKFCSCPHVRTLYGPRAPPNKPRPFQYALHACCNVCRQATTGHMYQKLTSVNR